MAWNMSAPRGWDIRPYGALLDVDAKKKGHRECHSEQNQDAAKGGSIGRWHNIPRDMTPQ